MNDQGIINILIFIYMYFLYIWNKALHYFTPLISWLICYQPAQLSLLEKKNQLTYDILLFFNQLNAALVRLRDSSKNMQIS